MKYYILFFLILTLLFSCGESENKVDVNKKDTPFKFSKIDPNLSNINFQNKVEQSLDFNYISYYYISVGGGVASGDLNNDGLEDLYFVSNQGPNRLYENIGDFKFKDITKTSKTSDPTGFSTGVMFIDINNDTYLDIYVCKAGSINDNEKRRNKLFLNLRNGTFAEVAKQYGLDDPGYSIQAYPIDYDKDGDLDIYVVNHRPDFNNNFKIEPITQNVPELTSDHLYRNDGNRFVKVTKEANLMNNAWGLSAVIGDFNEDGWDDIHVSNDFSKPDHLYINQKNGSFNDEILTRFKHITQNSMGSDFADLNNNLLPDLMTVDMLSENYARSKENMASMDIAYYHKLVDNDYHHTYMANMLHINTGDGNFIETGQLSGLVKTDWSWATLMADFDNDGLKDIFIGNGIEREYNNQDSSKKLEKLMSDGNPHTIHEVLATMPSERIQNYIFKNEGGLTFSKKMDDWGLTEKTFTHGVTYSDLDNDGDLDLVMNNTSDVASVYKNESTNNYVQVALQGTEKNRYAIGTKVYIKTDNSYQLQEVRNARGYESSVSPILTFGIGQRTKIQNMYVSWPNGTYTTLENPEINKRHVLNNKDASAIKFNLPLNEQFKKIVPASSIGINYTHKENDYYDYGDQLLLPQKQSTKGTGIVSSDVNGDGLEDFFVGNASGSAAAMYIQKSDGTFKSQNESLWNKEADYEDANALFFDADNDGDQDLYVVSAGYELDENSPLLKDRLYLNDGKGNFNKSNNLPDFRISGKSIVAGDYDNDGDIDLFVGGNVVPKKYPLIPKSYLLRNENGTFLDATPDNQVLSEIGMVSDATFTDYDGDKDLDLLVVGEWMEPTFFKNTNGSFEKAEGIDGLDNTSGWWFAVSAEDFDGDGDQDYILGNLGLNNKFQPKQDKPIYIYGKDFDDNGSFDVALTKINNGKLVPVRGKECSSQQNPFLLDQIKTYKEFASLEMKDIYGEDRLKNAYKATAHMFESVYVENLGGGKFTFKKLPKSAQLGPTLSFITKDFNKDGHKDIMGIGAIYDAEVETIRYDSNLGYVLFGDGEGNFHVAKNYNPNINSDTKDVTPIKINGKEHFIVVSNNTLLEIFTFNP